MFKINIAVTGNHRKWSAVKRRLKNVDKLSSRVGWLKPKYHKTPRSSHILVSVIAKWMEEGMVNIATGVQIPPRPFIRIGLLRALRNNTSLQSLIVKNIMLVSDGKMTTNQFYKLLGKHLEKILKNVIENWNSPPNAPLTIKRKGFNNPLIETGYMRDSVESDVSRRS